VCSRCQSEVDEQIYHYTYIYVRCQCDRVRSFYLNPDKPLPVCTFCGTQFRRTSDPRVHKSSKRPIVLHERKLPNGQVVSWAPFTPDTPPPKGATVREVSSVRELERLAQSGDVADILKHDEARLDDALVRETPADPALSEETMFAEEMQMRRDLGLSTDESKVKESIADTMAPALTPLPTPE